MKPWHLIFLLLAPIATSCIEAARVSSDVVADPDTAGNDDAPDANDARDVTAVADTTSPCDPDECPADDGCVARGTPRPGLPCQLCAAVGGGSGWAPRNDGDSCEDDDPCTPTPACQAGACVGVPDPVCVDPPSCVASVSCADARCVPRPVAGTCFIDGACWASGGARHGYPCQRCQPASDPLRWSAVGSGPCDDGDACTLNDTCKSGACEGKAMDCDDKVSCTGDACSDGQCAHVVVPGKCYIDGECYSHGKEADDVPCGVCDSAHPNAWSPLPGSCDDGDACTGPDSCDAGVCQGPPIAIDAEPNDAAEQYQSLGAATLGLDATFPSGTEYGNLNPAATDRDMYGYAMLTSFNGSRRRPKIRLGELDASAAYELCIWLRCGVNEADATSPTVACPVGTTVTLAGGFAGCCASFTGAEEYAAALAASCPTDPTATGVGIVRVRVQADHAVNSKSCPAYALAWGAVSF